MTFSNEVVLIDCCSLLSHGQFVERPEQVVTYDQSQPTKMFEIGYRCREDMAIIDEEELD